MSLRGYLFTTKVTKCKQIWKRDRTMLCSLKHNYCTSFYFSNMKIYS